MDQIKIRGGQNPLVGTIGISGAKNASLPLMIGTLLTDKPLTLHNVPDLSDILALQQLLCELGTDVTYRGRTSSEAQIPLSSLGRSITLHTSDITSASAPYDMVRKMRASCWVMGPLLARGGKFTVSLPGGCAIGTRPIDFHLKGFAALGASIDINEGYVVATAPSGGLRGAYYCMEAPSVGATINMISASVLAQGDTTIDNVAREPEVVAVCDCLIQMGAKIEGVGSSTLYISGVSALDGVEFRVPPDRIEAGTYAIAAAITGGKIRLENACADHLRAMIDVLRIVGATVDVDDKGITVSRSGDLRAIDVETSPFPGFPTDLQAQLMALLCVAKGTSRIRETIFENRFMHVPELARLGADITHRGDTALITGVNHLSGAQVMATDLRASVSLVLAGLVARGETVVNRVYHLDRGFARLESKLSNCGADVERVAA